jgi:GNAT superfamily N-acetyltransferase
MSPESSNPAPADISIRTPELSELAAVRTLRQEELNGDQPLPAPVQPTEADLDPRNLHMAAFHGDRVVSAVRVDPQPEPAGTHHVNRMVTRLEYRGQGIGARVLESAEAAATERGATRLTLHAREAAVGFYEKAGYAPIPPAQPDKNGHLPMEKHLEDRP